MRDDLKGVLAMVAASSIWGLSPIYYKALAKVPPLEVLSHRTLWSFVIFALVLAGQGRLGLLFSSLLRRRTLLTVAAAGLLISLNWFVFILSIQIGRAVEASLGYYVFPLVAVALGFLAFHERLDAARQIAVALAGVAVLVLTFGLGTPPWISLILASSFGLYGLLKKGLDLPPVVSVTGEVLLLLPLALIWLWGITYGGWSGVTDRPGGYFGTDPYLTVLLVFSGVLTAGPLMLFAYAARRLRLSTVGLIQYLNPTLQFTVAVVLFQERITVWHASAFALIWVALTIYSWAGWRQEKSRSNAASSAATEVTTDR